MAVYHAKTFKILTIIKTQYKQNCKTTLKYPYKITNLKNINKLQIKKNPKIKTPPNKQNPIHPLPPKLP